AQYEQDNFALDPALGGARVTYLGNNYLAIPFYAQAVTYAFSVPTFVAQGALILHPVTGGQLIGDPDLTAAGGRYSDLIDPAEEPQKSMIATINAQVALVASIANAFSEEMLVEATKQFYLKADVDGEIEAAIDNFAESVWLAA
ncbi:MAG TPA: hypothetical protein PLV68_07480, partial [Ilumatobacteraceae bacterium]|nr:hypothetical protein [Ilumatobacteraceae bacterium]